MNTERVGVLKEVVQAHRALQRVIAAMSDTDPNRQDVQAAIDALEDVQDLLFIKNLEKKVLELKRACAELNAVNAKIKKDTKKLKHAADKVKKAAKAIGILADVVAKAAALL